MFSLLKPASRVQTPPNPCANCGYRAAVYTNEKVIPDFNLNLLPAHMRHFFRDKKNGVCLSCGVFQSFNRPDAETIATINLIGKDPTTSWDGMKSYPVEKRYIDEFDATHYAKRLKRWTAYFDEKMVQIKRALILRSWFGAAALYLKEKFGTDVSGIDMSESCIRTAVDRVPDFHRLEGTINHAFQGSFLNSGPYDAVFVFHVLTHSCDYHLMLRQIKNLLKPGGFLFLTHETVKKPANPFHMMHLGEFQLKAILRDHFDRIDRIDDCGTIPTPTITAYTEKGDEPDFVAWLNPRP